ncbi:MAG: CxxC motif-containing protein (DUF1111 family) [Oleiphilaceae bacterium]|jgi:CxxC motif-containing protein (DUF1111 family)
MTLNHVYKKGSIATLLSLYFLFASNLSCADSQFFSYEDLDRKIGQAIFEKFWVFAPSSTKSSDGLGPLYNARSCHQCHESSKKNKNNIPSTLVIQLSIEPKPTNQDFEQVMNQLGFIPEPIYGKQLQTFAYPGAKAEADISVTYTPINIIFPDGEELSLSKPSYLFTNMGYGKFHKDLKFSPRVAPRMTGLNWLDSIPEQQITSNTDPDDINKDGISGKANWVWDDISRTTKLGRFGWKAGKPNLEQQNLAALSADIGVSSWLYPQAEGDCTLAQSRCTQLAKNTETQLVKAIGNSTLHNGTHKSSLWVEASKDMTDLLLLFTATMDQKNRSKKTQFELESVKHGKELFNQIGCQNCHISTYKNITDTYKNNIKITTIYPYTDLLLHDMGDNLADNRKEFEASGNEWRTAPLWGISDYLKKSPNPVFLHDGRAKSTVEAILWHAGEAEKSKQAFMALTNKERIILKKFVESL